MDPDNLFFTRRTAWLVRFDYLVVLALLLALLVHQWPSLNLVHFLVAIAWQDLIGYYPAAALFYWPTSDGRRRPVPHGFYVLYNLVHGVPLNAAVLAVWWALAGGWEPAMLAIPIHLCIDRGVFGRFYKSFSIAFEPVRHPEFVRFAQRMASQPAWQSDPQVAAGQGGGTVNAETLPDGPLPAPPVPHGRGRSAL